MNGLPMLDSVGWVHRVRSRPITTTKSTSASMRTRSAYGCNVGHRVGLAYGGHDGRRVGHGQRHGDRSVRGRIAGVAPRVDGRERQGDQDEHDDDQPLEQQDLPGDGQLPDPSRRAHARILLPRVRQVTNSTTTRVTVLTG